VAAAAITKNDFFIILILFLI
jgi:hypothetical protein